MMRFSPDTFTATLKYIARENKTPLDVYDMVKLHVLTDFYHILEEGEPAIGGTPKALPYGPVVQGAYDLSNRWAGSGGDFFSVNQEGSRVWMAPSDDGTANLWPELADAASQAWGFHNNMTFEQSQDFFHKPDSYFGKVWTKYRPDPGQSGWGTPIEWNEVIEAYQNATGEDCADILTLLTAPTHGELVDLAESSPPPKEYWGG